MMFGLPAACLAMYHEALPERKKAVGGMLFSLALMSFLTGVTEPIEFSFMFLAPVLYAFHAILTGISEALMNALGCGWAIPSRPVCSTMSSISARRPSR